MEQEIAFLLEWYICECIRYAPGNPREWWSDGVEKLVITQTVGETFKLLGVTWIGSLGRTPFDIDVELNPTVDEFLAKTIFRIGSLDADGKPRVFGHKVSGQWILETRPREDKDWALAIELTPRG